MAASCSAQTRKGTPCKARAVLGTDRCVAHQADDVKASLGFGPEAGKLGGRPRQVRATEALNEAFMEAAREHRDKIIAAYIEGLDAERTVVVGNGPTAHTESVPDPPTRLTAAEKLTDRVVGKPRQSVEHSGPDGGPIQTDLDLSGLSAQELRALRALLDKAADGGA